MAKTKEKVIGGIRFTVAQFPAIEALRLKAYLVKTLGPALAEAIDLFKGTGSTEGSAADANISGESLCGVVEKLTASLSEDEFVVLVKRMLRYTSANGKDEEGNAVVAQFADSFEESFNRVFAGRLFDIYPVMLLVLEANYPDFFGKVAGSIGSLTSRINGFEQGSGEASPASTK